MMIAIIGTGAGTGAGTAGGDGAVGVGYATDGAVIDGTVDFITIDARGTALMANVPDWPSILTL